MESNRSQQLQTGFFLMLGLLGVLVSIMMLGGDKAFFKSYATLYSKMPQVQGLNRGSVVSLAGITIGNVQSLAFEPDENTLVVGMQIEEEFLKRIPADSTVDVRTQGALGDKYIYITPGAMGGAKIEDKGVLLPNPAPDFLAILSERGGEAAKIFDVLSELQKLLANINGGGRVETILNNFAQSSVEIKALSKETRELMTDMRTDSPAKMKQSIEHLNSILTKIDRGDGTLGALINDPSLHQQLKALVGESPRRQYMQSVIRNTIEKSEEKPATK